MMDSGFGQSTRQSRLSTVLGEDVLNLSSLQGSEVLSGNFTWEVHCVSKKPDVDLNALLGTHATVVAETFAGDRFFDGIVTAAERQGAVENQHRYHLTLRPWMHLAGLRRNQRIFKNQTVDQILTDLFADYANLGAPHVEFRLSDDYPELEYTVQYGETDANFARRMMERFGITWFYEHNFNSHTLVLTDYVSNQKDVPAIERFPAGERPYFGAGGSNPGEEEHFNAWHSSGQMTTGAVRLTEYNFKTPHAAQEVERIGTSDYINGQIESFDYPGDYLDQGEGDGVVSRRIDQESSQGPRIHATGNVMSLGAGLCVTPMGDELEGATGQRFLCLQANHSFRGQSYGSSASVEEGDGEVYVGSYVLMPTDTPMRPARRAEPARIYGPQTGMVVGDGEIDCDEYGRIWVKFHWDLGGMVSMRCRVSQNWASQGWGGMVIPRVGMEVIVEFINGDPDYPIVTGCVYNGHNMPPYTLPEFSARSTFRTNSHNGSGYNELRFEDEGGQEEVFLHAQKYFNGVILQDETWSTGGSHHRSVGGNMSESIGGDRDLQVGGDLNEEIGGDQSLTVGGVLAQQVGSNAGLAVNGEYVVSVASDMTTDSSGNVLSSAGMTNHVSGGMDVFIDGGMNVVVQAGMMLTLKAGASFITLDPSGVSIVGPLIKINSGGAAGSGSPVSGGVVEEPNPYNGAHASRYDRSSQG